MTQPERAADPLTQSQRAADPRAFRFNVIENKAIDAFIRFLNEGTDPWTAFFEDAQIGRREIQKAVERRAAMLHATEGRFVDPALFDKPRTFTRFSRLVRIMRAFRRRNRAQQSRLQKLRDQ